MEEKQKEEAYLAETLCIVKRNVENYEQEISGMSEQIDEMLQHYHDNDVEVYTQLSNTVTMREHMQYALMRNQKALRKPYFGRIDFLDETLDKKESLYIGRGGIARDTTHQMVIDWRAPVANAYYENGLGECSYSSPDGKELPIRLDLKRTYEIEDGRLIDFFDTEVISNDDLLTKYLAKNKQAVLGEIIATIQKEQNDIIRKSPYHNMIVQGVAGSGKTTVAMHRISFILYNYAERFRPEDFYIVGSNRILLEYITGVLPDLDVYGIRQMTMEQLFVRLLYEDWDEQKYRILENTQNGQNGMVRGSTAWFLDLQAFCEKIEQETIRSQTISLDRRQFVEGYQDGETGVFDRRCGDPEPGDVVEILSQQKICDYVNQTNASVQMKINMLNEMLIVKLKDEFLKNGIRYTEKERKAILKEYRGYFGKKLWQTSIFQIYREFLLEQQEKGHEVSLPENEFDVYDLAALAYLYKRLKETEVISEAHHVVIDEAQDYGMMAYAVLNACIKDCTYTIMGDVSQNIHFGFGLTDWEELRKLLCSNPADCFGVLRKSYRNTVEISEFATNILHHGSFEPYPVEPIIRHGKEVELLKVSTKRELYEEAAKRCREWQKKGLNTIAVICRSPERAEVVAKQLGRLLPVCESDLEKAVFSDGVMVLPVAYTKGLEFDAVLILDPDREEYPVDDGHAKLLYVAATRALHELSILYRDELTGLIADPLPEGKEAQIDEKHEEAISESPTEQIIKAEHFKQVEAPNGTEPTAASGTSRKPESGKLALKRKITDASLDTSVNETLCKDETYPKEKAVSQAKVTHAQPQVSLKKPKVTAVLRPQKIVTPPSQSMLLTGVEPIVIKSKEQKIREAMQRKQQQEECEKEEALYKDRLRQKKLAKGPAFGDMPDNQLLRPMGHSRIDLSVLWVQKQPEGLYLQSRYGVLRVCPLGQQTVRISFAKDAQRLAALKKLSDLKGKVSFSVQDHVKWTCRETGTMIEMTLPFLCLKIDKKQGNISFLTRDGKLLFAERSIESRLIDLSGQGRSWQFFDWKKTVIHIPERGSQHGFSMKGSARYIHGTQEEEFPILLSDRRLALQVLTVHPVICCDIPAYGSYVQLAETAIDYLAALT